MKRMLLVLLSLVFIYPVISRGADKDSVNVKLVWEKEIPEGATDFVFLDENGYNVFSVQCENPEKALKEKRILIVDKGKLKIYRGDEMQLTKEMDIKGSYAISKNGHNIAVLEGLKRNDKGGFEDKPATLRLLDWKGNELARTQISPRDWEYIDLFPLGNDSTVILNLSGGEGLYYKVWMFSRNGSELKKVFSSDGYIWTYAENGSIMLLSELQKKRLIMDGSGKNIGGFSYSNPRGNYWAGISPKGNYIAEVTTGKSVVIHNKYGTLISEHHVQGQGNYYGVFSPDEKYLLISPGFRKIYFFNTKTGNLIWEYEHSEDKPSFFPGDVTPDGEFSFIIFTPSREESKWIWIFNKDGIMVNKIGPLNFTGYSLPINYISKTHELFIKLPTKILLYSINK